MRVLDKSDIILLKNHLVSASRVVQTLDRADLFVLETVGSTPALAKWLGNARILIAREPPRWNQMAGSKKAPNHINCQHGDATCSIKDYETSGQESNLVGMDGRRLCWTALSTAP